MRAFPLTKRESAILKVYEMACTALKWRLDRGEITIEQYIDGCHQLLHAYHLDCEAEHA
jgi:hypothetical protein